MKIIVIGATSGIGKEIARVYAGKGHSVGITGRRENLLAELKQEFPDNIISHSFDISKANNSSELQTLINMLNGLDLLIISAGTGIENKELEFASELETINLNVKGFTEIAVEGFNFFKKQKHGHIVGISSLAAFIENPLAPAYSATKAYQSMYLKSLRVKSQKEKLNIYITDIRPGFVDTAMAKGDGLFWVAPVKKAAEQIANAIMKKKKKAYITKRWGLLALLLKLNSIRN